MLRVYFLNCARGRACRIVVFVRGGLRLDCAKSEHGPRCGTPKIFHDGAQCGGGVVSITLIAVGVSGYGCEA